MMERAFADAGKTTSWAVLAPLLLGIVLSLDVSVAYGGDWTTKAQVSQGLEVNDNRPLTTRSPGTTVESISRATLDAMKILPGSRFGVGGDLGFRALGGAGADDFDNPIDNSLWFKFDTVDKLTKYNLLGSWRRQDAVSAQIEDSGLNTVRGDINMFVLEGGLKRQLSAVDSLSWTTLGKYVDIESSTAAPFSDVVLTAAWTRRQTATLDLFQQLQVEFLTVDDAANTRTQFLRSTTGFQAHLTKDTTFRSSAGAGWVDTERDGSEAIVGPVSGVTLSSASRFGVLADAELTWRPLHGTQGSIFAYHNLMPNTVGEIEQRTRFGIGVKHAINKSSVLNLSAEISRQEYLDRVLVNGSTDFVRVTASHGYQWTPEWQTRIAYKFTHRQDDLGGANSNAVLVSVVRDINLAGR